MSAFLFGVPGKLGTLLSRVTSGVAAKLDYLDAAITSRAAASTAVSSADYTSSRAGYLDQIRGNNRSFVDPRRLPLWWDRDTAVWENGTDNPSAAAFWSSDTNNVKTAAKSSVATNDTYVTVCDVSGRGVFTGVMGPIHDTGGYTTTFRITVDGAVYTIAGTLTTSGFTNARLMLWATSSPVHEYVTTSVSSDGIIVSRSSTADVQLSSVFTIASYNHAHVYFSTGLKVEVKISTIPAGTDAKRVMVGYLLEKG